MWLAGTSLHHWLNGWLIDWLDGSHLSLTLVSLFFLVFLDAFLVYFCLLFGFFGFLFFLDAFWVCHVDRLAFLYILIIKRIRATVKPKVHAAVLPVICYYFLKKK